MYFNKLMHSHKLGMNLLKIYRNTKQSFSYKQTAEEKGWLAGYSYSWVQLDLIFLIFLGWIKHAWPTVAVYNYQFILKGLLCVMNLARVQEYNNNWEIISSIGSSTFLFQRVNPIKLDPTPVGFLYLDTLVLFSFSCYHLTALLLNNIMLSLSKTDLMEPFILKFILAFTYPN